MDRTKKLAEELIGDKHHLLYYTNVHFKYAIDMLSRMLPAMVDGLAIYSQAMKQDMDRRINELTYSFPEPLLISKKEYDKLVPLEKEPTDG